MVLGNWALWPLPLLLLLLTSSLTVGDDAAEFHALVEKAAESVPNSSLEGDVTLIQVISGEHTVYRRDPSEKDGVIVLAKKGSDEGKSLIVLKEGEDYLPVCNEKRIFVVLKQVGEDKKKYKIFYAYVHPDKKIEFESWNPRGNTNNRATSFGFTKCGRSNMVPCKEEVLPDTIPDYEDFEESNFSLPANWTKPPNQVFKNVGPGYWCDIEQGEQVKWMIGEVIDTLSQGIRLLTGAEVVYTDKVKTLSNVKDDVLKLVDKVKAHGRSSINSTAVTEKATEKIVDMARGSLAGGALIFLAGVVKVGALAVRGGRPLEIDESKLDEKSSAQMMMMYKLQGIALLRSLLVGGNTDEKYGKTSHPNPLKILDEGTIMDLVEGKPIPQERGQEGRGPLGWLFGGADVLTSTANGEQAIRQYGGVQKTGEVTGSKGIDNLNYAIDNAFGGTKKSAGQVFSENLMAGVYAPYGLIEDAADGLSGSILGVGKVSTDRSYVDDIVDKAVSLVGGAAGQVVDVVGDILAPVGLGGLWTGVAGVAAAGLGGTGAVLAAPGLGINQLVKMGAKALGIGGVIGMYGEKSRGANDGGNQNFDRKTPAQAGYNPGGLQAPGGYPGKRRRRRRRRDLPKELLERSKETFSITDTDLFSHFGWRTMDIPFDKLDSANLTDEVPYIGFGNCEYKTATKEDFEAVKTGREAIKFYLQTLRMHCIPENAEVLVDLMQEKTLTYDEAEKTFSIKEGLESLSKPKLSSLEVNILSRVFEFEVYTKTYASAVKKEWTWRSGDEKDKEKSSRTADTLRVFVINFMELIAKKAPLHYAKLIRNLAKFVKTAVTKSLQDFYKYKYCRRCVQEKKGDMQSTLTDTILYSVLLEFLVEGQVYPEFISLDKEQAFKKYYESHKEKVVKSIVGYFQ